MLSTLACAYKFYNFINFTFCKVAQPELPHVYQVDYDTCIDMINIIVCPGIPDLD